MNSQCRFCGAELQESFCDLGVSPLANSYLRAEQLNAMEPFYPLHVFVCAQCLLVQVDQFETPQEIFADYAYFSSYSESWLQHAQRYCTEMIARFGFGANHQVVEIASNDGYLLQFFRQAGIPVLGVEPAKNVAQVAVEKGVPTRNVFFNSSMAHKLLEDGCAADLLVGNNVLAHVPDINDFVAGLRVLLKEQGVITLEFPHLGELIRQLQFDTIYHEHFSYLSLLAVQKILAHHGLRVFDVRKLSTHGGSIRVFACHDDDTSKPIIHTVTDLLAEERGAGLAKVESYREFNRKILDVKLDLLDFFVEAKRAGKSVVAYGAAAKGNTLLNYCGIGVELIDYVVDRSPHKQGLFLPGTHIPIKSPDEVRTTKPDYLLVLPWNLKDEIIRQMDYVRAWGGKFVIPIPTTEIVL